MLQTNPSTDPIVEILRLAYRRGLAILHEREIDQATHEEPLPNDTLIAKLDTNAASESEV